MHEKAAAASGTACPSLSEKIATGAPLSEAERERAAQIVRDWENFLPEPAWHARIRRLDARDAAIRRAAAALAAPSRRQAAAEVVRALRGPWRVKGNAGALEAVNDALRATPGAARLSAKRVEAILAFPAPECLEKTGQTRRAAC
jgi:hypothetical protein